MMEPNYFIGKRVSPGAFLPLPPAYRGKLRIPTFAGNYNNNLQNVKRGLEIEVNEMICLWEALFPDDQNSFQLHQIMDLVSSIPLHGSMLYPRAFSEGKDPRAFLLETAENSQEDAKRLRWLVWSDEV